MSMEAGIMGTGIYLPERVVTNEDLSTIVDTSDEWISTRTGMKERRFSSGEETWYMGWQAAEQALENAGLAAEQIDVIVVTSTTPDYYTPSMASVIQGELGATKAFAFDLNAACSGFVFAYDLAAHFLLNPAIEHVLIVSAESLTKLVDYTDRSTCVLFGDGAAAVVVGRNGGKLIASDLGGDGKAADAIVSNALRSEHPFSEGESKFPRRFAYEGQELYMDGHEVYRFAVRTLAEAARNVLEKSGVDKSELTLLVPHQANNRIIQAAARRLDLQEDQVFSYIEETGNISSATIPYCLHALFEKGELKKGDKIVICGFGAGLTYGASLLEI